MNNFKNKILLVGSRNGIVGTPLSEKKFDRLGINKTIEGTEKKQEKRPDNRLSSTIITTSTKVSGKRFMKLWHLKTRP
jgi:hypothetical protein